MLHMLPPIGKRVKGCIWVDLILSRSISHSIQSYVMISGVQSSETVHCNTSTPSGHHTRVLAHGLGAQQQHHRLSVTRDRRWQGKSDEMLMFILSSLFFLYSFREWSITGEQARFSRNLSYLSVEIHSSGLRKKLFSL